jgi:MoxR-like ATPase
MFSLSAHGSVSTAEHLTIRTNVWHVLDAAGQCLPRVLLYGPPGTGKTFIAYTSGLSVGTGRASRVVFTEDTAMAELRGSYIPRGGTWEWSDGPVTDLYRRGGRLVADEITRASDDALSFMLGVLDGLPITLPTGETIAPHDQFSVWATTNDDVTALSDALADRFVIRVKADQVNPKALATLPAEIRRAVSTGADGITMREGKEFARLLPLLGARISARLVWESRAADVLDGMGISSALMGDDES